jgi:hypothetical protein
LSIAVIRTVQLVDQLIGQDKAWLEIQAEVEKAKIKQGGFKPLYVGCDHTPYRIRFIPAEPPLVTSRDFDQHIHQIAERHSLVLETRCTGYFLYAGTRQTEGFSQMLRKSLGMSYRTKLQRLFYLDKYGIELEHPEVPGASETLEEIGVSLYGMAASPAELPVTHMNPLTRPS